MNKFKRSKPNKKVLSMLTTKTTLLVPKTKKKFTVEYYLTKLYDVRILNGCYFSNKYC